MACWVLQFAVRCWCDTQRMNLVMCPVYQGIQNVLISWFKHTEQCILDSADVQVTCKSVSAVNKQVKIPPWCYKALLWLRITHHGPGVFPLGQFVQDPQQVDAREQVPPAELVAVTRFLRHTHKHTHTLGEIMMIFGRLQYLQHGSVRCFDSPGSRLWAQASHGRHSVESPAHRYCNENTQLIFSLCSVPHICFLSK